MTMNSGLGSGTPRSMGRKGVRKGREAETRGHLKELGVGRTGKRPASVPQAMLAALGVVSVTPDVEMADDKASSPETVTRTEVQGNS